MALRIIFSLAMLTAMLFFPIYISAALALAGFFMFEVYAEAIFIFLLSDLLYGAPVPAFHNFIFVSFFTAIACLLIIEFIKNKLKFYPKK